MGSNPFMEISNAIEDVNVDINGKIINGDSVRDKIFYIAVCVDFYNPK